MYGAPSSDVPAANKQLERTVIRRRWIAQRAAAQLRRYAAPKGHLMFRRVVSLIVAIGASGSLAGQELPEAQGDTIGYATVSAALEALKAKSGTKVTVQDGWTVI